MKYQDLKIRDAARVAAIGVGCGGLAALLVLGRDQIGPVIGNRYEGILWGAAAMAPICLAISLWYLFTSPAQNARFLEKRRAQLPKFDWSLLDSTDPDYDILTISYLLRKIGGRG